MKSRCSQKISLSKFNLPLIGTFTWPTPPGPCRATTCRGRELNYESHTYFFDHTRTWRASPDEWSAQCRGLLRDSANMKDSSLHTKHTLSHPNKANMEWWLRRPNDIRGPWGPKASRHLSYRWGKTPKKTSPRKLVMTGDRIRARCVTSAHTTCSTAVDVLFSIYLLRIEISFVFTLYRGLRSNIRDYCHSYVTSITTYSTYWQVQISPC